RRLWISTEGISSARLDNNRFLFTPYRVDRATLDLDDPVLIEDGACQRGQRPSRAARIHQAIYNQHPEIRAIVNAYPVNATAFGVTDVPLDSRTIPESYLFLRDIQRLPFGLQFNQPTELARRISLDQPVALLQNDGVLVCGTSILDAFDRLEVLESTAEALIDSHTIGNVAPMPPEVIDELCRAFLRPS